MNGRNAKLLRKMRTTTKRDKRNWNNLSADEKFEVRLVIKNAIELGKNTAGLGARKV